MHFEPADIGGVFIVRAEPARDERGWFARTFCRREFEKNGLLADWSQGSLSHNRHAGTLRGMHYQAEPHSETKLIRCVRGAVYDVALDLRRQSPTFKRWLAVALREDELTMLYLPPGVAHGFQTLQDESELEYWITPEYVPDAARGVRWNDPAFGIDWPRSPTVMSARDASFPDFR